MYIIITSSPNKDGLTAACGKAAMDGITRAGGQAELIDISERKLEPCKICAHGWGTCVEQSVCVIDDCLAELQGKLKDAEGVFLVTPVYYAQVSERMRYFYERLRRCEAMRKGGSWLAGKQVSLIAAAGISGNGTAHCLDELETFCGHVRAIPQERIGVTQYNRGLVLKVIEDAGERMVRGEYFKPGNRN